MPVQVYRDGFERGQLDSGLWDNKQIEPRQVRFTGMAPEGQLALEIAVSPGDGGAACDAPCQRAEIRQHGPLRPAYGEEVWQAFRFKVTGNVASTGSLRTVIGQWKAPGDESPFLAQRFDNGVFHVTVQDGHSRRVVASAAGDPDRLKMFQSKILELAADPAIGLPGLRATTSLWNWRHLSDVTGFGASSDIDGAVPEFTAIASKLSAALKVDNSEKLFDEFSFIHELELYGHAASIQLVKPASVLLPDPKQNWVHMTYRIRCGRLDNQYGAIQEGQVDIYADGQLIAEVRGNLGYRLTQPPADGIYCKFGVYRDLTVGEIRFHFDDFRQGRSMADVS